MNETTKQTSETRFQLPVRLEGLPLVVTGNLGRIGWTMMECGSRADAVQIMRRFPSARMPCWARIEAGEI